MRTSERIQYDADLKTSLHDEIVLWMIEGSVSAEEIMCKFGAVPCAEAEARLINEANNIAANLDPGNVDVISALHSLDKTITHEYRATAEKPIVRNGGGIVGYIDVHLRRCMYFKEPRSPSVFRRLFDIREELSFDAWVEVKTVVPSFGELMRQLRLYRHFLDRGVVGLVVPMGAVHQVVARVIAKQGFPVYECPFFRVRRSNRCRQDASVPEQDADLPPAEEVLLELAIGDADLLSRVLSARPPERFKDPERARIARAAAALLREGLYSQGELMARLGAEGRVGRAIDIVGRAERRRERMSPATREDLLARAIADLERRDLREGAEEVRSRLREAEARGDREASARYLAEYARLQHALKARGRAVTLPERKEVPNV